MNEDVSRILKFWFGADHPDQMTTQNEQWWTKDTTFDRKIEAEFSDLYQQAVAGALNDWKKDPFGCLALIILLDQFPRNMFRNTAQAFASDEAARDITRHVLEHEMDTGLPLAARLFMYLPLEHSENVDDQNAAVTLISALEDDGFSDFAIRHRDIIKRFGRFPHRNAILGRTDTPEEVEFLKQPGSGF
jgi:uncharacterized protein (DUF924 family)